MDTSNSYLAEGVQLKGALNGWIDLSGNFYRLNQFAQHNEFASNVLEDESELIDYLDRIEYATKVCEELNCSYAYEALTKRGWIRIVNWGLSNERYSVLLDVYPVVNTIDKLPRLQRNTLKEWLLWNEGFEFRFVE
jgi:hypothetical protein